MTQVAARSWLILTIGFVWQDGYRAPSALADPPRVNAVVPAGVERGVTTEVVISGTNLAGQPRWLGSFGAAVDPAGKAGDGNSWRVRITPGADVPVGVYLVRVQTEGGLSNPFPFAVDQVPHVAEAEDNSSFVLAQPVEAPVVVEGEASGSDVDFFRFAGHKGERVVIDAACARIGSGVDPSIRLSTAGHRFVASADDTAGLITDARLFAELPSDGDYVVELSDTRYQGTGPKTNYRLLIGPSVPAAATVFPLGGRRGETVRFELSGGTLPGLIPLMADVTLGSAGEVEPGRVAPWITEASLGLVAPVASGGWWVRDVEALPSLAVSDYPEFREPADPAAAPLKAPLPAVFNGRIEAPGDSDAFAVAVTPGQKIRVAVEAAALGSMLDGVLQVKGLNNADLANDDDFALPSRAKLPPADPKKPPILSVDPEVSLTIPAGTTEITVNLRDLGGDGGPNFPYRLTVEPVTPGFTLAASTQDQVNIPRGGTSGIAVEVERRDFAGPIRLIVPDPPVGVSVRPGLIPAGQTVGSLTVSATSDASFDLATLHVTGEATGPAGPIAAEATRTMILAKQADFATRYITRVGLPAAPSSAPPVVLTAREAAVEVIPGYAATIPVQATRAPGAEDVELTFGALPTIPNLAVAPDPKLAAKALAGAITLNTNGDLALGPLVAVFTAKGKFAGQDRTLALPAVTLNVVRPATIELNLPRLEVLAGGSADVRGKVLRRGAFREPVTIKLDGLPAGLKAEPVVVPPDATDFKVRITADIKAAPVDAAGSVGVAFQIAKKDYPTPPTPLAIKVTRIP